MTCSSLLFLLRMLRILDPNNKILNICRFGLIRRLGFINLDNNIFLRYIVLIMKNHIANNYFFGFYFFTDLQVS